jgi:hypothetical protein
VENRLVKVPRTRDQIAPDEPVPLAEACQLFFGGEISPSTLRTEHHKGNLVIERIANRDFVTLDAIKAMREKCRLQAPAPTADPQQANTQLPPNVTSRDILKAKLRAQRETFKK